MQEVLKQRQGLIVNHVGSDHDLDFLVFLGDRLIGMGEVKSDIDPQIAASSDAQAQHDAYLLELPKGSGQWGVSFTSAANFKSLKSELPEAIALAKQHELTFVAPEQLWHEDHEKLREIMQRLGLAHFWLEPGSSLDRALLVREPWGGLVPDHCPSLQNWITETLLNYQARKSIAILNSSDGLEQRHFVICIESNSPLPIRLYALHHALEVPMESLELPSWITDLWIILPRGFQNCDIAWRYSSNGHWGLFASDGFLEF